MGKGQCQLKLLFLAFFWFPVYLLANERHSLEDILWVASSNKHHCLQFIFNTVIDKPTHFVTEQPNRVILDFHQVSNNLPQEKRHLSHFAPGITKIEVIDSPQKIRVIISLSPGVTSQLQLQREAVCLLIPDLVQTKALPVKDKMQERLSLNFQDIDIRAVLQILADFTGLNIVASEAVRGKVTLRLENVPAHEALDTILKANNLVKKQQGKVLMIAPREEMVMQEKQERQAQDHEVEAQPLQEVLIPIRYAKASELALILKKENNALLSIRGSVAVDDRTNTLFLQEIPSKLKTIQRLIKELDIPVRQVLIESRIVFAKEDFEQALGLKLHTGARLQLSNDVTLGLSGTGEGAAKIAQSTLPEGVPLENRLNIDLPAHLQSGLGMAQLGFAIAKLPKNTVLDLELMALESEGLGKIVARPRLVTSNQQRAYIETGEEIPYQEATSSGAASVAFRKAVLRLEVIPHITPDNNIILDLKVNQDSRGALTNGVPAINTREMHTKVLVADGETVVLGGIYQQQNGSTQRRIPYISQIPLVGVLFKNKSIAEERNELMIFVTPKILSMQCADSLLQ